MNTNADQYEAMLKDGFVVLKSACDEKFLKSVLNTSTQKLKEKLKSLGDKEIGIGSAAGYKEICQRSVGRWDVPIDLEDFDIDYKKMPWWPIIVQTLGEDAEPCFQGVVSSAPNTPAQEWHIDSPHLSPDHLHANVINVLITLEDVDLRMGPSQVAVGSHIYTNHLVNPKLVINDLVYQCSNTSPKTLLSELRQEEFETWTSEMPAGTCLIFDDRILHRGQANQSNKYRHVAYFSYRRKGYDQNTYFESDKTLEA